MKRRILVVEDDAHLADGATAVGIRARRVASAAIAAASAISTGSLPPSCSATGCSAGSKPRSRSRSPWITADAVTISV